MSGNTSQWPMGTFHSIMLTTDAFIADTYIKKTCWCKSPSAVKEIVTKKQQPYCYSTLAPVPVISLISQQQHSRDTHQYQRMYFRPMGLIEKCPTLPIQLPPSWPATSAVTLCWELLQELLLTTVLLCMVMKYPLCWTTPLMKVKKQKKGYLYPGGVGGGTQA